MSPVLVNHRYVPVLADIMVPRVYKSHMLSHMDGATAALNCNITRQTEKANKENLVLKKNLCHNLQLRGGFPSQIP